MCLVRNNSFMQNITIVKPPFSQSNEVLFEKDGKKYLSLMATKDNHYLLVLYSGICDNDLKDNPQIIAEDYNSFIGFISIDKQVIYKNKYLTITTESNKEVYILNGIENFTKLLPLNDEVIVLAGEDKVEFTFNLKSNVCSNSRINFSKVDDHPPNIFKRFISFTKSVTNHIMTGMPIVTEETYNQRIALCTICPWLDIKKNICNACGCSVLTKAKMTGESCPVCKKCGTKGKEHLDSCNKFEPIWGSGTSPAKCSSCPKK